MHKLWSTIRAYDPALVLPPEAECSKYLVNFMKTRDEATDLPLGLKDGAQPTRYWLRPIPKKAMGWIRQGSDETEVATRAFTVAIDHVDHLRLADGTYLPRWDAPRPKRTPGEIDVVPLEECDLIAEMDMAHIGKAALDRATIPFDCGGFFLPLPSCASACLMRIASESHRAESARPTSEDRSADSRTPPPSDVLSTEPPGGVTAVEMQST